MTVKEVFIYRRDTVFKKILPEFLLKKFVKPEKYTSVDEANKKLGKKEKFYAEVFFEYKK